jgi:hypothetical protein
MSEKITVTKEMVEASIAKVEDFKLGDKTTAVLITMTNGFEVLGTSACVDASNYVHEIGVEYATERAKNKIWELLAFNLQDKVFNTSH